MEREIIREYTNGELTVVWKPKTCIHAGICAKTLPEVYNPKARPWIQPDKATTEALKAQIDQCPSGALSYYMNAEGDGVKETINEVTKVQIMANGPLLVHGTLEVTNAQGEVETKKRSTAFCRCGASKNKPYCDGSHNGANFIG